MSLALPPIDGYHPTLDSLLRDVNEHAGPKGYAVVLFRIKKTPEKQHRKA